MVSRREGGDVRPLSLAALAHVVIFAGVFRELYTVVYSGTGRFYQYASRLAAGKLPHRDYPLGLLIRRMRRAATTSDLARSAAAAAALLRARRGAACALFVCAGVLTYYVYPSHYADLLAAQTLTVVMLVLRNAFLLVLAVVVADAVRAATRTGAPTA